MIKYNKLYYASLQLHDSKKLNFRKRNMNMSIAKHYSGGLTREQFLFYEIRTVASLVSENVSRDEIYIRVAQENLFQYPTERMIRSMTNICFKRIDALASRSLTEQIAKASATVAKQINLYAIMRENGVVYDFMTDVIGEKFRTQQMDFSHKDINCFLDTLQEYYPAASDWSESTRGKIRQVITRFLGAYEKKSVKNQSTVVE